MPASQSTARALAPAGAPWVYIRSEPGVFTVGFYDPHGRWESESDHSTRDDAAARVHYLNGGAQGR